MKLNQILGTQFPIMQGGMAQVATGAFAAAVSNAGALGIIVTLLLNIPINIIIKNLTDISDIAHLPAAAGVILVLISMLLTVIAGVIPSRIAAKKDPVIALRSE